METEVAQLDYAWWNWFLKLLGTIISIVGLAVGGLIAHWYWKKQKAIEKKEKRDEFVVESIKAAWQFLEYFTDVEYPNTIIVDRGTKEKQYKVLRMDNAVKFIELIPEVLYRKGYGVILPKYIEKDLLALRAKLYTFIEREFHKDHKGDESPGDEIYAKDGGYYEWLSTKEQKSVKIKNPKYWKSIEELATSLKNSLKSFLNQYA